MHCEQAETLLALLIYDELEAEQKTQLTAHLAECPACAEKLSEMRAAANMLKEAVEAGQPPVLSEKRREALMKATAASAGAEHKEEAAHVGAGYAARKTKSGRRFLSKPWRRMHSFMSIAAALFLVIVLGGMLLPSLRHAREEARCLSNLKRLNAPAEGEQSVVLYDSLRGGKEEAEEDYDQSAWADGGGGRGGSGRRTNEASERGEVEEENPNSKAKAPGGRGDIAKAARRAQVEARSGETGVSVDAGTGVQVGRAEINKGHQLNAELPFAAVSGAPAPSEPKPPAYELNERLDLDGGRLEILSELRSGTEGYFHKIGPADGPAAGDASVRLGETKRMVDANKDFLERAGVDWNGLEGIANREIAKQPPARVLNQPSGTISGSLSTGGAKADPPLDLIGGEKAAAGKAFEKAAESPRPQAETRDTYPEPPPPKPASVRGGGGGGGGAVTTGRDLLPAGPPLPATPMRRSELRREMLADDAAAVPALPAPVATTKPPEEHKAKSGGGILSKLGFSTVKSSAYRQLETEAEQLPVRGTPAQDGKEVNGREQRTDEFGIQAKDAPWKEEEGQADRQVGTAYRFKAVGGLVDDDAKFPDIPAAHEKIAVAKPQEEKPAFVKIAPELAREPEAPQGKATEIARITEEYLLERNRQRLEKKNKAVEESGESAGEPLDRDGEADETVTAEIATIELPAASTFKAYTPNPFVMAEKDRFSTFGLDVDTASYVLARNYIRSGKLPPPASVRPEEFVNSFDYNYPKQTGQAFAVNAEGMPSPFAPGLALLKIGIQGKVIGRDGRKPAHLAFVIDSSGSMARADRLPLVQEAIAALVKSLQPLDRVSIVTYGTDARLAVQAHPAGSAREIIAAVNAIQCGGSTNLLQGIQLGYQVAQSAFRAGETNRVILCSDGVANVGLTDADEMLRQVEQFKRQGISFMSVGFGMGSYNDELMQKLADRGDGSYVFIDTPAEARRVMAEQIAATLQTIAKDAKIQVEFNPASVRRYRLIGYEKREIADEDFRNDAIDAGEVGSGQSSTALYEIELLDAAGSLDLGTVFVRYRDADTEKVEEISSRLEASIIARRAPADAPRLHLAAAVAQFAEILRESEYARSRSFDDVRRVLGEVAVQLPLDQRVRELLTLVESAKGLPKAQ